MTGAYKVPFLFTFKNTCPSDDDSWVGRNVYSLQNQIRPVEACGILPQIKPSLYLCLHFITQARHAAMQVCDVSWFSNLSATVTQSKKVIKQMQILVLDYTSGNLLKATLISLSYSTTSASPREHRRTRTAADAWPHIFPHVTSKLLKWICSICIPHVSCDTVSQNHPQKYIIHPSQK